MFLFAILVFLFVFPKKTFAYLDPGTGSYFFQLALGGILGVLVSIRVFSKEIRTFIAKRFRKNSDRQPQ